MGRVKLCFGLASIAAAAAIWGCSSLNVQTDCEELRTCPSPDAGEGGGGDVVAPPGCDLTKSPKDSAACVDDAVGVFVSASGDDGATGKKSAPVKSIAKGVELAASRGVPRVYVCEGTYNQAVEVKAAFSIFGGLTCAWAASETVRPKLAPAKGIALKITNVSGAVVVEDLEVVGSADAATPGDSAIGAFVSGASNVTFRRTTLTAGAGTAGAKGASRTNYAGATATAGGNANGAIAGTGALCACTDASLSKGGNGAAGNGAGFSDGSATPAAGAPNAGTSGTINCTDGQPGANGAADIAGVAATSPGELSASGWGATTKPADGPNGKPGQGGGGGGAKTNANSAGGGGACGGCGGAGGGPGSNGGSSFALLSFNSTVTVDGGTLATAAGGAGGAGGDGQDGQTGGALGAGACNGGPGASGAGGSGGGGGAGGHSVPVGFVGTEPKVTGATLTPGAKGGIGSGGTPGLGSGNAGTAGTPGPEGKSQKVLPL